MPNSVAQRLEQQLNMHAGCSLESLYRRPKQLRPTSYEDIRCEGPRATKLPSQGGNIDMDTLIREANEAAELDSESEYIYEESD